VNCYVTTNAVGIYNQWIGNSSTAYFSGASSDKNGRANFTAITASASNYTATSAVGLCKALGTGWYLPAYEELYAMSSGAASGTSNNRAGIGILNGTHWSSSEAYQNAALGNTSGEQWMRYGVQVSATGVRVPAMKNANLSVRCARY
jgi:hypothetical protein